MKIDKEIGNSKMNELKNKIKALEDEKILMQRNMDLQAENSKLKIEMLQSQLKTYSIPLP